jgi:hypothetical protein
MIEHINRVPHFNNSTFIQNNAEKSILLYICKPIIYFIDVQYMQKHETIFTPLKNDSKRTQGFVI